MIRAIRLRHLHLFSCIITLIGVITLVVGLVITNGEVWQLVGLMLVLAGIVKVVVVQLWSRVAGLETDRHDPVPPV
jgi:hypothetical protein